MAMARSDLSLDRLPVGARIGVGAGLLALLGGAYYVIFYSEISSKISSAEAREGQLRGQLSDARKAEFAYQKDLAELTLRQQRQREFNKVLPTSSDYPAFLSAVQNVANASGVLLTAWSPSTEVADKFYARVPMKLEVAGRYHQIAKFFYGVGQLERIINMENISLTEPKVVGEDVLLKVEGLATAFRALETTDSKSGDKRGQAKGAR